MKYLILVATIACSLAVSADSSAKEQQFVGIYAATQAYLTKLTGTHTDIQVVCAKDKRDWVRILDSWGFEYDDPKLISAFVIGSRNYVAYSTWVCKKLMRPHARDNYGHFEFGAVLYVIAHEAVHLSGIRNEATASCVGINKGVPYLLKVYWPNQPNLARKALEQAKRYYRIQPENYTRKCQV